MTDRKTTGPQLTQVGRLALRHEGEVWNAYYAMPDTMEDPVFLGSIRFGAVANDPARKQRFMDLMREIVSDIIFEKTGLRPTWGRPQRAPEHERSGQG